MLQITNNKISLVLSGGAARGAFHLGILSTLDKHGIEIMAISGSSIGAIVGAGYLSGKSPKEMLGIFTSKEFKKALKFTPFSKGFFTIDKNAPIVNEVISHKTQVNELSKPFFVSITDLADGYIEYKNEGNLKELLLATSALVPLFPAINIKGKFYADGGIVDNFPLSPLKQFDYPVLGVNLHPNTPLIKHNLFSHFGRALFLGWHAGVAHSIKECDYYIAPDKLSNYSIFRFKYLEELFEFGEKTLEDMLTS